MQEEKQVPKFSSFKAKPIQPTEDVKKAHRVDDDGRRRDERDRHRSKHRSHRHRSYSRDRLSKQSSRREEDRIRDIPSAPPPPKQDAQDIYKIDRKGDIHNVIYGTIHRYSIPQYRRTGRGAVLGLHPRYKIDRAYDGEDFVIIRTGSWVDDGTRHKNKSLLARTETKERHIFRVRQSSKTDTEDVDKNFIPLSHDGSRKRQRISSGHTISDNSDDEAEKYGYRSIHGKAKPEQDIPSDMEAASESEDDEDGGNAVRWDREANKRNSELLKRAEDNPEDVDAWLLVIKYQNTLLTGSDSHRQLTAAEKRSLADIKLSLYEKALKKVGKHPEKDRLLLGYLEEGTKLWESKRLSEQWHTILKHNPSYISLWVRYIDFRQTAFLEFTFERCRDIYLECMNLNASSSDNSEKEVIHLYLFLRMTLFMREAGFSEMATGLWQAALEMTIFRPDVLVNSSKDDVLNAFASFWASEVARIGDPGSKGWKSGKNPDVESFINNASTQIRPETLFSSWNVEERRLIRGARMPARTLDIVENDDPYRVVLWSDIEVFLNFFTNWQDNNILVEGFLKFCYLPPTSPPSNLSKSTMSGWDAFLRTELVYLSSSCLAKLVNASIESSDQSTSTAVFDMAPLQNMVHSTDSLFADNNWFQSMALWKQIRNNEQAVIDAEWARRCLKLLVGAFPQNDRLAEYVLAVDLTINPNEARKYAKSLLKKRPSSLQLYNAYALMEFKSGNVSTASHVWATTFSMAANLSEAQRLEYGTLIQSWVWECLVSNQVGQAIKILASVSDFSIDVKVTDQSSTEKGMSPAQCLKIQRYLSQSSDHSLSIQNLTSFASWIDLTALLQYLTNSFDLSSALKAYIDGFSRLASSTRSSESQKLSTLELLHQSRSRLLYHHITSKRIYKPTDIREILLDSTNMFPHNTILLSLFTWNEGRFRIDERIRTVLITSSTTLRGTEDTPIPITSSLLSILAELTRPIYSGSTIHSGRAAFERALQSSSSSPSASPSIWILYIYFERFRAKNPSAAQQIYYRAIRACPWFKDLLMLAFDDKLWVNDDKNGDRKNEFDDWWELRQLYNVLVDKELRIHVEIEDEVFEEAEKLWVKKEQERMLQREGSNIPVSTKRRGKAGRGERRGKEVIHLPDDADSE